MKLVAVMWRELVERRVVLLAALLLGIATVCLPLLPFIRQYEDEDLRVVMALLVAGAYCVCLLLIVGSGMLCRDWRERRMSYFFARPISGWQLWFGKCAAVALMVLLSVALILLPAILAGTDFGNFSSFDYEIHLPSKMAPWGLDELSQDKTVGQLHRRWQESRSISLGTIIAMLALAAGLSHGLGVFLRLGGGWSLVDVAGGVICLWLVSSSWGRLSQAQAGRALDQSIWCVLWALLLWPLLVGWYQVSRGSVDRTRAHAVYSSLLWAGFLVLGCGVNVAAKRLLNSPPAALEFVDQRWVAPVGPWSVIAGPVRGNSGYQPVFAVNEETGSWHRLESFGRVTSQPSFSPTGDYLVWTSYNREQLGRLHILDLTSAASRPRDTGINLAEAVWAWHPDGQRLAVAEKNRVSLLRASDAATLASRQLQGNYFLPHLAVEKDRVRLYLAVVDKQPPWRRQIFEWQLDSGEFEQTGSLQTLYLSLDPLSHKAWTPVASNTLSIVDERSGAEKYQAVYEGRLHGVRILASGGLLLLSGDARQTWLYRFDDAGELHHRQQVAGSCWLANQHSASEYWLGCRGDDQYLADQYLEKRTRAEPLGIWFGDASRRGLLVDIDSGEVVREEPGLVPYWQILPATSPARNWLIDGQGAAWQRIGDQLEPV